MTHLLCVPVMMSLVLLVGCAGSRMLPIQAFEQKLNTFTVVYFTAESALAEDVSAELTDLEARVAARLEKANLFEKILLAERQTDSARALLVNAVVTNVKKVSGTTRFFAGAFAGKASLTAEVTFSDGESGKTIGSYFVTGESGGTGMSGGTESAVDKTAEAIVKLIKDNL